MTTGTSDDRAAHNARYPPADDGLYLLSGLLSCELCNRLLVPVMLGGLRHRPG